VSSAALPFVRPLLTRARRPQAVPVGPPPLADPATLPLRDPRQATWPGGEVTSGGVTLHVRETLGWGDTPAVYVHGLSGSATNWTDLAGLLATRAPGTAVDLPGFGLSRPLASRDYSPAGHADALLCFLAGRGRPVHLLGNSFGGAIALAVAARRPELVRTLTLVSPAMPDLRPDPRRVSDRRLLLAMLPLVGKRARAELAAMDPRTRAEQVVRLCFGDPAVAPEHRLAEAAAEIAVRAHRQGHGGGLAARGVAVVGGGPRAGTYAGGMGRARPARRAPAGRPHRRCTAALAAARAAGCGARRADRGAGDGGARGRGHVGCGRGGDLGRTRVTATLPQ
jgi:pimeloyl-ACP methyl ester carboxylesterase